VGLPGESPGFSSEVTLGAQTCPAPIVAAYHMRLKSGQVCMIFRHVRKQEIVSTRPIEAGLHTNIRVGGSRIPIRNSIQPCQLAES
jgi:hypothetical protein